MTVIMAVPTISNTFSDAEVIVIPNFGFTVNPCKLYHFFETREKAAPISRHTMPKVNSFVVNVSDTATLICGLNSKREEVPNILLADTILVDGVWGWRMVVAVGR